MEFVEYYQIIKRRIWLAVVLAGITASVVVVARLMPTDIVHEASGMVMLDEKAKQRVRLVGNELHLGLLAETGSRNAEARFWADLEHFIKADAVMQAAASRLNIPATRLEERAEEISTARSGSTNALQIRVGADTSDLAVRLCDAIMEVLGEAIQGAQLNEIRDTAEIIQKRIPEIREDVDRLAAEMETLTSKYDGQEPPALVESLNAELTEIDQQLINTELSARLAKARSDVARSYAGASREEETPSGLARSVSPRVQALQEAIIEKQIELDESRSRRTEQHQEVKAIQAQIDRLQARLEAIQEAEASAADGTRPLSQPESALAETVAQAEVEAEAHAQQIDMIRERAAEIRNQLPVVRVDARKYEELYGQYTALLDTYETLQQHVEMLEAEREAIEETDMVEIIDTASAIPQKSTMGKFALNLGVALAVGGGLGIVFIFVLHYIDFSFQNEDEAEEMLDAPVLTGIPRSDLVVVTAEAEEGDVQQEVPEA